MRSTNWMLPSLLLSMAFLPTASAAMDVQGPRGGCTGAADALCKEPSNCPSGSACEAPKFCAVWIQGNCKAPLGSAVSGIVYLILDSIPV